MYGQVLVCLWMCALLCTARSPTRMCGIIGIFKQDGLVNVELYEGLLMLQVCCSATLPLLKSISLRGGGKEGGRGQVHTDTS